MMSMLIRLFIVLGFLPSLTIDRVIWSQESVASNSNDKSTVTSNELTEVFCGRDEWIYIHPNPPY